MSVTQALVFASPSNYSEIRGALRKVHVCFFLAMTKAPLGAHVTHHLDRVMRTSWGSPRLN